MTAGSTVASCNSSNTDPLRQLNWFPLSCSLSDCPDEVNATGYNQTADNGWQCASGYSGKVIKECQKGVGWSVRRRDRRRRQTTLALPEFLELDLNGDMVLNLTEFARSERAFIKADLD